MIRSSVLLLSGVVLVTVCLLFAAGASACEVPPIGIDHGQYLTNVMAANGQVALCPGTIWHLQSPIRFPFRDYASLYTEGYPLDGSRALLSLESSTTAIAVLADFGFAQPSLRNVQVDGSGSTCTGFATCWSGALLQFGGPNPPGTAGPLIDGVKAWGAKSWSHLVLEKGNDPGCSNGTVTNNEIGPSGAKDLNTDAVSLQCRNSTVAYNSMTNYTDSAVAIFGAPGSLVHDNTIKVTDRSAITGIAMSDDGPWQTDITGCRAGDYTNTTVYSNTITTQTFMCAGIAMGHRLDSGCVTCNNYGAVVRDNVVASAGSGVVGYSFPLDGVTRWTVRGNRDLAYHGGTTYPNSTGCNAQLPKTAGFPAHFADIAESDVQPEFSEGGPNHAMDIRAGPKLNICGGVFGFCGVLRQLAGDRPSSEAPNGWTVSICDQPAGGNCHYALTNCSGSTCGAYINNDLGTNCVQPKQRWWLTVASTDGWGQTFTPIYSFDARGDCATELPTINVPPAPLVPTIFTPSSGQLVTTTAIQVTFANAFDPVRKAWPGWYEVAYKFWPSGTSEPGDSAYHTIYTGPCQGGNQCLGGSVDTSQVGQYRVRVQAKLDVSASILDKSLVPLLYTNERTVKFSVAGGRCLGCRF